MVVTSCSWAMRRVLEPYGCSNGLGSTIKQYRFAELPLKVCSVFKLTIFHLATP